MSSTLDLSNARTTIVLFQAGLGDSPSGFDRTKELLASASSNVVKYPHWIDMRDFHPEKGEFWNYDLNGYFKKSNNAQAAACARIADLVAFARRNRGKAILASTWLDLNVFDFDLDEKETIYVDLDSIENQALKLIWIINKIKELDQSVTIDLVGHSQGGLVNMEAASGENLGAIHKMISISTPYSPCGIGQQALGLAGAASAFGFDLFEMMLRGKGDKSNDQDQKTKEKEKKKRDERAKRYRERVAKLTDRNYFDALQNAFENSIGVYPPLTIIAGVSGLRFLILYTGDQWSTVTQKLPFDGLVGIAEQTAIDDGDTHVLVNPAVPCFESKGYLRETCFYSQGFYSTCNEVCSLPLVDLGEEVFKIAGRTLWNGGNLDPSSLSLIEDIYRGANGEAISNEANRRFYDVYAGNYSHAHLRHCPETIAILLNCFRS